MTYLITGATGDIGSRVVRLLIESGNRPRIFVRDPEKARMRFGDRVDIAVGDLAQAESLQTACAGIDTLFLVNSGPDLAVRDEAAARAAKAAGVTHLVKLSSMDALQDVGTGVWHALGEAAIRASGIGFTFVKPSGFMSNALFWAASIKAEGVVRAPTGDGKIAFIHPHDIAAVAVKTLTSQDYLGESLPISGPEVLSYAEMTAKISAASGRRIRFQPISEEEESQLMAGSGDGKEVIAAHASIYRAIRDGRLAILTENVERVTGRKPTTFDQWARDHAAAFQ